MTWHSDWGNDSSESIEICQLWEECIKEFTNQYLDESIGTEEIKISRKSFYPYIWSGK